MGISPAIEKGIQFLSRVAIIEGRGKLRDGEVVFYRFMEGAEEGADRAALEGLGLDISYYDKDGRSYAILRERASSSRRLSRTHVLLFLATVLTTLAAGAILNGNDVFREPWAIIWGWPFSLSLMAILGIHEFGHYYYARRHRVDVTPPYFIPLPPPITFIGTLGAFIRMRGPIPNRLALLEIGAAGPIAGFLVAVPALFLGLHLSTVVQIDTEGFIIEGNSLLYKLAKTIMFPELASEEDILLHPVAFAGWIGLLVTMLNLLPLAQLDGGHIAYALLGDRQEWVGRAVFVAFIPMGILLSPNWLFWGLLILLLMRTVRHPPVPGVNRPLTTRELAIGIACLILFILCFIPIPLRMS